MVTLVKLKLDEIIMQYILNRVNYIFYFLFFCFKFCFELLIFKYQTKRL